MRKILPEVVPYLVTPLEQPLPQENLLNRFEVFTVGYGHWPVLCRMKGLLNVLQEHQVDLLIDIRHSPCSSYLSSTNSYGSRDWHLRTDGSGIINRMKPLGISYRWIVELVNAQKNDCGNPRAVAPH